MSIRQLLITSDALITSIPTRGQRGKILELYYFQVQRFIEIVHIIGFCFYDKKKNRGDNIKGFPKTIRAALEPPLS